MSRHVDQEPPEVVVARLTLRTEEVKERTAPLGLAQSRVSLVQARVGLATEAVKTLRGAVAGLIAAAVLVTGIVSCDRGAGGGARHDAPAMRETHPLPQMVRQAPYGQTMETEDHEDTPADPWETGDFVIDLLGHGATLWDAVREAADRGAAMEAVCALGEGDLRAMVFSRVLTEKFRAGLRPLSDG